MRVDEKRVPLPKLGPRSGFQLRFRVGRYDARSAEAGGEKPKRKPRHESGLAGSAAGSCGRSVDFVGELLSRTPLVVKDVVLDGREFFNLPRAWARVVFEGRALFSPGESKLDEGQRIIANPRVEDFRHETLFVLRGVGGSGGGAHFSKLTRADKKSTGESFKRPRRREGKSAGEGLPPRFQQILGRKGQRRKRLGRIGAVSVYNAVCQYVRFFKK